MSTTETGGPAFPVSEENYASVEWSGEGVSVRYYFAAKAMQGMTNETWPDRDDCREISRRSYMIADAMLEARRGTTT